MRQLVSMCLLATNIFRSSVHWLLLQFSFACFKTVYVYFEFIIISVFLPARDCGAPGEINNGWRDPGYRFTYPTRVTYYCNEGYELRGKSPFRDCQANGEWSGILPECERKQHMFLIVLLAPGQSNFVNDINFIFKGFKIWLAGPGVSDRIMQICRSHTSLSSVPAPFSSVSLAHFLILLTPFYFVPHTPFYCSPHL